MKLTNNEINMIFKALEMAATYYQFKACEHFGDDTECRKMMIKSEAYHQLAGEIYHYKEES